MPFNLKLLGLQVMDLSGWKQEHVRGNDKLVQAVVVAKYK